VPSDILRVSTRIELQENRSQSADVANEHSYVDQRLRVPIERRCARLSDCHGAGGAGFTLQVELLFRGHGDFGASYGGSDIALVAPGHAVQMGQQRTDNRSCRRRASGTGTP